jgi:hypothetical protein
MEAFDLNCEAFIKTARLFEDIFREMSEMEAFFIDLGHFERF